MEDKFLVTKALLECYPYIEDMHDALSRSAEKCAADGFYAIFASEQMRLYEQIMKYNNRKTGLYNMKYLTEEGVGGSALTAILRERYLKEKSAATLSAENGIPLRTVYRRLEAGHAAFTSRLEEMGFDKKRLLKEFGNEPLFLSMLKRVIDEEDEKERIRDALLKVNVEAFGGLSRHNHRRSRPHRDSGDDRVSA
ncbi:MAG: hypothetical protein J6U39_03130 [Clostridia bacterium]|nr:hypothetical protein [Clostridia bacterium]MBP5404596.1 hypothetical protein [Clostridia bacterium]